MRNRRALRWRVSTVYSAPSAHRKHLDAGGQRHFRHGKSMLGIEYFTHRTTIIDRNILVIPCVNRTT